jgi:uncharacterized protein YecA (UPF0149 family)
MAAEKAGVDTCDQKAMSLFMIEHNLRQVARMQARETVPVSSMFSLPAPATPIRHAEPKIGRNDPCPCGSGKKFKKCCGT